MRLFESARVGASILFCLALVDRAALLVLYPFDGLYGQDAYAYYEYARTLFSALTHFQAPPPFWWPLGYPVLLNLAWIFGASVTSAQSVTLVSGALVAPLAYALAREAAPPAYRQVAAWTAGLICVFGGQLAQSSVVIMADAPALMFTTLAGWLLVRYARTGNITTLGLASLAVGYGVWIRWQNLIFAGAWFVTLAVVEYFAERAGIRARAVRFFFAVAVAALVLVPQFWIGSTVHAPLAGQSWLEGWTVRNFLARSFENVDGHFDYALPVALFYAQVAAHPAYLFALLTPLFGIGVWVMTKWAKPEMKAPVEKGQGSAASAASLLLLGWIVGMYLFLAGIPYENFRFSLGMFAPVAVVTGIGAGWVVRQNAPRWRFILVAWVGLACVVMLIWQPRVLAPVLEIKARELNQARWLASRVSNDTVLWTMGVDGALETYTNLRVENLWDKSADTLRATAPAYLFIDTKNFGAQWRGRQPDTLYRELAATDSLQEIGTSEGWTLFRIAVQ